MMGAGFINRVLGKTRHERTLYDRQLICEGQGVFANNTGVSKADCPYDRDKQQLEWNFWNYGWDLTQNERQIVKAGGYFISSTAEDPPKFWVSLDNWKPKYLASTNIHPSSS